MLTRELTKEEGGDDDGQRLAELMANALPAGVVVCKQSKPPPRLYLARMDEISKRMAWECFKRNRPGLAQLLGDPTLKKLCETFKAEITIPLAQFKNKETTK